MAAQEQGKFWEYHDKIFANMKMLKTAAGLIWGADADVRAALGIPRYVADPDDWRCA